MNGLLDQYMTKIVGANWITKIGGLISGLGGLIVLLPKSVGLDPAWGGFLSALGGVIVGLGAKDFNNHSTQAEVKKATREEFIKKADETVLRQ